MELSSVESGSEDTATTISQESLELTANQAQSFNCRWTVFDVTAQLGMASPVLGLLRGIFGQVFQPGNAGLQEALHNWAHCTPHGFVLQEMTELT